MDILISTAMAAAEEAAHAESTGLAGMFGINWQLFVAQLINFAIVLFVLWKWVFKPVSRALEKRTARIEQSLKDAERITEDKAAFEQWKDDEIAKARIEASEIVTESRREAESLRAAMMAETQGEQARVVEQTRKQLKAEQDRAIGEIKEQIADLVVAASEKVLGKKMDSEQDRIMVAEALKGVNRT